MAPAPKHQTTSGSSTPAADLKAAAADMAASTGGQVRQDEEVRVHEMWREDQGKSLKVQAFYPPTSNKRTRSDLTMVEVAKHNKREDAWIVIDGHCYDVTAYIEAHPGGWLPIVNLAGKDVTDAFANYHPARIYEQHLPRFYIGEVADYEVSDFVKEHRALRQKLLERNLFQASPWYFGMKIGFIVALFFAAIYLAGFLQQRVLGAIVLGVCWQQMAFIGHDVGHNAITHVRENDLWWGAFFGNMAGGIALSWWKRSHNVHHIVCNSVENDPDIQHVPLIAITQKMFRPFWSTYHSKLCRMDNAFGRFLVGHQHLLFYPVMAFARFNLYLQSVWLLLSTEELPNKRMEQFSEAMFFVWLGALCATFPTWTDVLVFLVISHAISGVLHVQITLSHFYMDTYHGRAYNDDSDEWFSMQLKTTMNVDCPWWMDWFHGGLQFQIEHHLWPRLPRHNLREASKLVKPFCKKHGLNYYAPGFIQGNIEMMRKLKEVAMDCRDNDKFEAAKDLYDSAIWNGLQARG